MNCIYCSLEGHCVVCFRITLIDCLKVTALAVWISVHLKPFTNIVMDYGDKDLKLHGLLLLATAEVKKITNSTGKLS